jgi:hypothetical protein
VLRGQYRSVRLGGAAYGQVELMNWAVFATWVLQIMLVFVLLFVLSAAAVAVWDAIKDRRKGGDE